MNRSIIKTCFLLAVWSFTGCDDGKDYIKDELSFEKEGPCSQLDPAVSILANTIGERYQFHECLGDNYDGSRTVERHGDTVVVQFPKTSSTGSLYKITLDLNTRPGYGFLNINGRVMEVNVKRY
jgi:hypothetical protein